VPVHRLDIKKSVKKTGKAFLCLIIPVLAVNWQDILDPEIIKQVLGVGLGSIVIGALNALKHKKLEGK